MDMRVDMILNMRLDMALRWIWYRYGMYIGYGYGFDMDMAWYGCDMEWIRYCMDITLILVWLWIFVSSFISVLFGF